MNTTQVALLSGVAGAIVGGSAVYFAVARPAVKARHEIGESAADEIDAIREYYQEKYEEVKEELDETLEEQEVQEEAPSEEVVKTSYRTIASEYTEARGEEGDSLHKEVDVTDDTEEEDEEEPEYPEDDLDYHDVSNEDKTGIEVVEEMVFEGDEWGYEYTSMNYFPEEDILVDSQDVPVEDVVSVVGRSLSFLDADNDIVHVVNHDLQLRIEIAKCVESFRDHIYGIRDENDPLYKPSNKE